jgi:hypothetical protein
MSSSFFAGGFEIGILAPIPGSTGAVSKGTAQALGGVAISLIWGVDGAGRS